MAPVFPEIYFLEVVGIFVVARKLLAMKIFFQVHIYCK